MEPNDLGCREKIDLGDRMAIDLGDHEVTGIHDLIIGVVTEPNDVGRHYGRVRTYDLVAINLSDLVGHICLGNNTISSLLC